MEFSSVFILKDLVHIIIERVQYWRPLMFVCKSLTALICDIDWYKTWIERGSKMYDYQSVHMIHKLDPRGFRFLVATGKIDILEQILDEKTIDNLSMQFNSNIYKICLAEPGWDKLQTIHN